MQRFRATTKLMPYLSSANNAASVAAHRHSLTKRPYFGTLSPSSPSLLGDHKGRLQFYFIFFLFE